MWGPGKIYGHSFMGAAKERAEAVPDSVRDECRPRRTTIGPFPNPKCLSMPAAIDPGCCIDLRHGFCSRNPWETVFTNNAQKILTFTYPSG